MTSTTNLLGKLLMGVLGCGWLWGCAPWELPALKTPYVCEKPSGAINVVETDQLRVRLSLKTPGGDIDSIRWDFGDGTLLATDVKTTVSQTYRAPNTYTVRATLTNACGDRATLSQQVQVTNVQKPAVVTLEDPEVQYTTARVRLQLVGTGNAPITRYGVCWSATSVSPSLESGDSTTEVGVTNPPLNTPITVQIPRLQANTPYRFRAFAVNVGGVGYGLPTDPPRRTNRYPDFAITGVECGADCFNTARVNWRVADPGLPQLTQYGVAYSPTNALPDVTNSPFVEASGQNVPISLPGLLPGRDYKIRLFVRTAVGVYYAPLPPTTYHTQSTLNRDLVLDLPFYDSQAATPSLNDMSGSGNDFTLKSGVPSFINDRYGAAQHAIRLQGRANEYGYVADNPALRPDAPLSISLWFQVGTLADTMALWSKSRFADGSGSQYNCLLMRVGAASGTSFSVQTHPGTNCPSGVAGVTLTTTFSLTSSGLKNWNNIVVVYREQSVSAYLNGEALPLLSSRQTIGQPVNDCQYGELKFGANTVGRPYYFIGSLDDIRLYRRELTLAEIQELRD